LGPSVIALLVIAGIVWWFADAGTALAVLFGMFAGAVVWSRN
jgi:hypothetical protein